MAKLLCLFIAFSFSCYGQVEKDSLLANDFKAVHDTLKVMHYLDGEIMQYYKMTDDEKLLSEKGFLYYFKKNVIGNNPVSSIDILYYLEVYLEKDIPADWISFTEKVSNANAKTLLELTEKYGFPSAKRLSKFMPVSEKIYPVNFTIRKNRYSKELDKMMRKEHRKENVSDTEFEVFKIMGGKQFISSEEIKRLSKKGNANFIIGN